MSINLKGCQVFEIYLLLMTNFTIFVTVGIYAKNKRITGLLFIVVIMFLYQMLGFWLYSNFPELSYIFDIGTIENNMDNVISTLILFTILNVLFFSSYIFFLNKNLKTNLHQHDIFMNSKTMICRYFYIISAVGIFALYLQVFLGGNVMNRALNIYSTYQFAGLISIVARWSILYAIVKYYIYEKFDKHIIMSLALIVIAGLVSGTSTNTLITILPFFILYTYKNKELPIKTLFYIGVSGYMLLTILRFARYSTHQFFTGASNRISLIDFMSASGLEDKSAMQLSAQGSIDGFAPMLSLITHFDNIQNQYDLHGQSYLNAFVSFIPGIIAPWKTDFLNFYKPDFILGSYLATFFHAKNHVLLPSGFWGEAYLNFGFLGIIIVAFVFGYLMAKNENLFNKMKYKIIPPPILAAIVISSFILMCRMYFSAFVANIVFLMIPFIILYFLPKKKRRRT